MRQTKNSLLFSITFLAISYTFSMGSPIGLAPVNRPPCPKLNFENHSKQNAKTFFAGRLGWIDFSDMGYRHIKKVSHFSLMYVYAYDFCNKYRMHFQVRFDLISLKFVPMMLNLVVA